MQLVQVSLIVLDEPLSFTLEKCIKKLLLLCSHPYFSCLGPGSLGGERWVPIRTGTLAPHVETTEVLCATSGVGRRAGVAAGTSSVQCPGGLRHLPPEHRRSHRAVTLGRSRRDLLVVCIWYNCVCHLDFPVLKLLFRVSLVRGVNRLREIFLNRNLLTTASPEHLCELSSRARAARDGCAARGRTS